MSVKPTAHLSQGWQMCRLGDCARLINGRAYSQHELLDAGTPVIRIQNLNGGDRWYYSTLSLPDEKYCTAGDLLFAWSASFGPYIWSGPRSIFHYHIWRVIPNETLDQQFAYYLLEWITERVKAASRGVAMLHMTKAGMENWEIPLPPLPEQRRIAAILDQAETLRTQRRAALAQLDSLTQSLFLDMFGGGGSKKLTIGELLDKGVLSLHKDGNHGSQYPRSEEFGLEGVPFLSARCVSDDGEIHNDQIDRLKEEKALRLRIGWIESGDVLLAHNASVGKVALYDGRFSKALIGTSLTAFRSNPAALTPHFLAAALRSNDFQTQLEKNMGQTTRNQVPITAQRELHIPLHPLPLQQTFATRVQAIEALKAQHRAALAEADALFASLQQRAFAGAL